MTPTTNHQTDAGRSHAEPVVGTARDEAGQLKETSADAARQVGETLKDKASDVRSDLSEQTRRMAGQTRDELTEQASRQKERAVHSLRSMGDELREMTEHGQSGPAVQLAQRGAGLTDQAADFLQKHEPGELLDEVRGFARRRPGTFLLVAAAAGVVAGRLTRALATGGAGTSDSPTTGRRTSATDGATSATDADSVPSAPMSAPPVGPTSAPPPTPTPVAPDPDPGAPVTPRFGPERLT